MSNNLPQIYNENIFKKFFKYIRNLFSFKKDSINNEIIVNENNYKEQNLKEKFIDNIKIENNNAIDENKKKKIMEDLKDNLQLLEECSNEKLEKILEYYLNENEEKKKILQKLSA